MAYHEDNLLIICGNEKDTRFLTRSLEEVGYKVTAADDGNIGFDMLQSQMPELVLLDLHITGLSAEQIIQKLSSNEALRVVPIILLAEKTDMELVQRCLDNGADDYLVCPYSPTLLKTQVKEFHEIGERRVAEQEQAKIRMREKIEHDVEIAREIQLGFLPRELPQTENWELAARFAPAREVAGDFYDAFTMVQGRRIGFVIADVCDKGVASALFMALIRSMVRAFAQQNYSLNLMDSRSDESMGWNTKLPSVGSTSLKNAVVLTNNYITENHLDLNYFATLFFGMIDPKTGSLTYINGGHCPPVILGSDGKIKNTLKATGTPVGMMPDAKYTIGEVQLEPGDILFGYTDGVTDARDPARAMFGENRMRELLQLKPAQSADELLDRIRTALTDHIANAEKYDDITMIAVHRLPE